MTRLARFAPLLVAGAALVSAALTVTAHAAPPPATDSLRAVVLDAVQHAR